MTMSQNGEEITDQDENPPVEIRSTRRKASSMSVIGMMMSDRDLPVEAGDMRMMSRWKMDGRGLKLVGPVVVLPRVEVGTSMVLALTDMTVVELVEDGAMGMPSPHPPQRRRAPMVIRTGSTNFSGSMSGGGNRDDGRWSCSGDCQCRGVMKRRREFYKSRGWRA